MKKLYWWWVTIGSGNVLVPDSTTPLTEPVLTKKSNAYGITMPQWVNSTGIKIFL